MRFSTPTIVAFIHAAASPVVAGECRKSCTVKSGGSNATDDAPAIIQAFRECGRNANVVFESTTYYVNSVMNISWLDDVEIDLQGTLLVASFSEELL